MVVLGCFAGFSMQQTAIFKEFAVSTKDFSGSGRFEGHEAPGSGRANALSALRKRGGIYRGDRVDVRPELEAMFAVVFASIHAFTQTIAHGLTQTWRN